MQKSTEFSLAEIVFVATNSIITKLFLIFPATLINIGESASLIVALYISIIGYLILFTISFLYKKFTNMSILNVTEYALGNFCKKIFSILLGVLFLVICGTFLRCVSESITLSLMPDLNVNFISMVFITGVVIATYSGLKGIVRCHTIVVPLTLIVILILFLGNISSFDINNIFPLFSDGVSVFIIGSLLCGYFSDCIIVTLILPYVKKEVTAGKIFKLSTIITSLALFVIVSAVLLAVDANTFIPVFKLAQNFSIGEFTPRLESLFTAAWFLSFFLNFSLLLYFGCKLFAGTKNYKVLILPFGFIVFAISVIPKNITELVNCLDIIAIFRIIVFYIIPLVILTIANVKKRCRKQ